MQEGLMILTERKEMKQIKLCKILFKIKLFIRYDINQ